MKRKFAFTLAEVLITLGVIGVVAAITMPTVIGKYQEKQTVTALKRTYSLLQQAFQMAKNENGPIPNWSSTVTTARSADVANDWYEKIKPYIKVIKYCGKDSSENCFADQYKLLHSNRTKNVNGSDSVKFILNDGVAVKLTAYGSSCASNACGNIYVDINSKKGPNTYGKDFFLFTLHNDKIVPSGAPVYSENTEALNEKFADTCLPGATDNNRGEDCTAWVIYNENMDYLHCDDISWNGKTKCK